MICDIPAPCIEVLYAGYEVGEGQSVSNHVKLTCKTGTGVSTYIDWQVNAWGLLGLNRISAPNRIDFAPSNASKLQCKSGS